MYCCGGHAHLLPQCPPNNGVQGKGWKAGVWCKYTAANENANSLSVPTLKFPVQLKTCRKKKVNKSRKCAQVQRMYTLKNAWAIIIIIITIIIIIIIIT